jgi:NAD(P)-dependent dehydrogenase (short-subunit alcohol dehydrogenase family)
MSPARERAAPTPWVPACAGMTESCSKSEVADVVADLASYVTGEIVVVDGGG